MAKYLVIRTKVHDATAEMRVILFSQIKLLTPLSFSLSLFFCVCVCVVETQVEKGMVLLEDEEIN